MDAVDALFAPYDAWLTDSDVAAVLGWSEPDARDLIDSGGLPRRVDGRVEREAARAFLLKHRRPLRIERFVPRVDASLRPLNELLAQWERDGGG